MHFTQGNYTATATITDQMNDEVVCIQGGCEITWHIICNSMCMQCWIVDVSYLYVVLNAFIMVQAFTSECDTYWGTSVDRKLGDYISVAIGI